MFTTKSQKRPQFTAYFCLTLSDALNLDFGLTPTAILFGYTLEASRETFRQGGVNDHAQDSKRRLWEGFKPATSRLRDLRSNPLGHRAPQH